MKLSRLLLLLFVAVLPVAACHHHDHNLSVTVKETGDSYRFRAEYPRKETGRIYRFINQELSSAHIFESADDVMDITTTLNDNTRFYVKSRPGSLLISVQRDENSSASYARIKQLCADISNHLKN
jgi:hypothetical protein